MRFFITALMMLFILSAFGSEKKTDSLINVLKTELARKKIYDDQKEERINILKRQLGSTQANDYNTQYDICSKLYDEYKVYNFDQAYYYTQKLSVLSDATRNITWQNDSRIKLGFILLSSGMFKEAFDCLNRIDSRLLNDDSKLEYYGIKARAFSDLGDYNNDNNYTPYDKLQALKYSDSAITFSKPGSFDKLYYLGNRQVIAGEVQKPSPYYIQLLDHYNLTQHQRAMVATGLGSFYEGPYQAETRTNLLIIGAINDIRSSTKETTAIFNLGQKLYLDGDLENSYVFIQQAIDDAQHYGARLRQIKISAVFSLVAAQKIVVAEKEKDRFLVYLLSITAVAILIALISFIVFIQLKRLRAKENHH